MPSAGFEPATPATKRPQTYASDRAATEFGEGRLAQVISLGYVSLHSRNNSKALKEDRLLNNGYEMICRPLWNDL
jgi:hypothetical protein